MKLILAGEPISCLDSSAKSYLLKLVAAAALGLSNPKNQGGAGQGSEDGLLSHWLGVRVPPRSQRKIPHF